jgi:hypothetical protein
LNPGARLILARLDRATGFFILGIRLRAHCPGEAGGCDFSHSAAEFSGISVRLPTLTAWSLPELISSYAVVLPTLYELQKSSTLNAAFDI